MRRWKGKTGAIEIQFNWIFVLIIGALIITFFVMIAQKQKQVSDQSLAADILSDMELLFTGQGVAVGREDVLEIPNIPIDVSCTDFSIMGIPKELGAAILFSPSRIEAEDLVTWTLSWDVPFKAANFMYMTGADDKYYVVVGRSEDGSEECKSQDPDDDSKWGPVIDSERGLTLGEMLPKRMDAECVMIGNLDSLEYEGNPYVKFIFLQSALGGATSPLLEVPDVFKRSDVRVSLLVIGGDTSASGWENSGAMLHLSTVRTAGADSYETKPFPAFGTEAVLGAIFASDYETYECMMGRAINRMRNVAKVYKERARRLITHFNEGECTRYLPYTILDNYIEFPDLSEAAGSADDPTPISNLMMLGDSPLRQAVRQAQRASCPTMY